MIGGTHSNPIDLPITNDGFFPDLNLSVFQEVTRVKADLAPELIVRKILRAIFYINQLLAADKTTWQTAGYARLDDVPQSALSVDGIEKKELLGHYEDAVYNHAMGVLHPDLVSLFKRKEASEYMDSIKDNKQDYFDAANEAILALRGTIIDHKRAHISSELL